jgi:hypothetical protein
VLSGEHMSELHFFPGARIEREDANPAERGLIYQLIVERQKALLLHECAMTFAKRLAEHARIEGNTYIAEECDVFIREIERLK